MIAVFYPTSPLHARVARVVVQKVRKMIEAQMKNDHLLSIVMEEEHVGKAGRQGAKEFEDVAEKQGGEVVAHGVGVEVEAEEQLVERGIQNQLLGEYLYYPLVG